MRQKRSYVFVCLHLLPNGKKIYLKEAETSVCSEYQKFRMTKHRHLLDVQVQEKCFR